MGVNDLTAGVAVIAFIKVAVAIFVGRGRKCIRRTHVAGHHVADLQEFCLLLGESPLLRLNLLLEHLVMGQDG